MAIDIGAVSVRGNHDHEVIRQGMSLVRDKGDTSSIPRGDGQLFTRDDGGRRSGTIAEGNHRMNYLVDIGCNCSMLLLVPDSNIGRQHHYLLIILTSLLSLMIIYCQLFFVLIS